MTFADGAVALADEHLTAEFFRKNGVRLSVEAVAATGKKLGRDAAECGPNFFYWIANDALHLVDFGDGFSRPLHECIDLALAIVRESGVSPDTKPVYWRSASKEWHRYDSGAPSSARSQVLGTSAPLMAEAC